MTNAASQGGNGVSTIFVGTLHAHADDDSGKRDMVASLHVWRWTQNAAATHQDVYFDGTAGLPKLYGLCGIAVGDLVVDPVPTEAIPEDLVLTTLDGDLLVYDLIPAGPAGVALGGLRHWSRHDGALGVCNSLLIADLDGNDDGNELYVATTNGVRKFNPTVIP